MKTPEYVCNVDSPSDDALQLKRRAFNIVLIEAVIEFVEKSHYRKLRKFYLKTRESEVQGEDLFDERNLVIFDVGANTGQTVFFFKRIFPTSEIYSFEPQVETFEKLSASIQKSHFSKVNVSNIGLSNRKGELDFYTSPLSLVNTFSPAFSRSRYSLLRNLLLGTNKKAVCEKIKRPVTTLDAICIELKVEKISILKIDVEGHELEVVQGARGMIQKRSIGYIQLERQKNYLRERKTSKIEKILSENGYHKIMEIRHLFGLITEDIYTHRKTV